MGSVKRGDKYEGYYFLKYFFIGGILTEICLHLTSWRKQNNNLRFIDLDYLSTGVWLKVATGAGSFCLILEVGAPQTLQVWETLP